MRIEYSALFLKQYALAPDAVKGSFDRQARFLMQNLRHPSLRAKKYDEKHGIWQARATRGWRFYFSKENDTYLLHEICRHPR